MRSANRIKKEKAKLLEGMAFIEELISKVDEREKAILNKSLKFNLECYNKLCGMEKEELKKCYLLKMKIS